MRRDADAGVRSVVHDDTVAEQGLRDAVRMWYIERAGASAPRCVTRRRDSVALRVGELDQARGLPNTFFADALDAGASNESRTFGGCKQSRNRRRSVQPAPSVLRVMHLRIERERMLVRLPPGERRRQAATRVLGSIEERAARSAAQPLQ